MNKPAKRQSECGRMESVVKDSRGAVQRTGLLPKQSVAKSLMGICLMVSIFKRVGFDKVAVVERQRIRNLC